MTDNWSDDKEMEEKEEKNSKTVFRRPESGHKSSCSKIKRLQ